MITGIYNLAVNPQWRNVQLQEVFLECDTTLGAVTINLFEIVNLNRFWNVKIIIADVSNNASVNNITINAGGSDTIDGDGNVQVVLNNNGESIIFQPVSENQWSASESNASAPLNVTYLQLLTLINNGQLLAGSRYLITDFQTIYDQPDYDALGVPKLVVPTLSGAIEPLIVFAINNGKISNQAWSTKYPNDTLKYNVFFDKTEIMNEPAKGRITYRLDDDNNQTSYDHRVVLFKRYETAASSGEFSVINDNGESSQNTLTFTDGSYNIQCGLFPFTDVSVSVFLLPNNIFSAGCFNIQTSDYFYNNTILNILLNDSVFQGTCHDNVWLGGGYNNNVANIFNNNRFEGVFQNNHIQNGFRNNTITGSFVANCILSGFRSNNIGDFVFNNIGYDFAFNNIGSGINNTIADNFQNNSIGLNMTNNNIFNNFINNTIADNFQANDIKVPATVLPATWAAQPKVYLSSYCLVINGFDAFGVEDSQPILGYYDTSIGNFTYSGL
jgi:hypothetical protein